jgi:hypothetical protein
VDTELALLAVLTCRGVKPMSRWEKPLTASNLDLLHRLRLLTRQIERTAQTGPVVVETVLAASPAYLNLYEERFSGRPIDKSAETVRLEGFLFGYPPCCIEKYIRKPYVANDLTDEAQRLLFYWACPGCAVTPLLLRAYREALALVESV